MEITSDLHALAFPNKKATRAEKIPEDANRPEFARDRDRILYSRCFRRLAHKTQVYPTSEGMEHARTRLTHTLEVSQIARTIARALRMNEDLVEAISLGHDVGHTPFGHAGEVQLDRFLQNLHKPPRHMITFIVEDAIPKADFRHSFQSVRQLTFLEKYDSDRGLNLTYQCLEGILKHTRMARRGQKTPYEYPDDLGVFKQLLYPEDHKTIESQIVAIADELAQVAHDLGDAVLYKYVHAKELSEQGDIQRILQSHDKGRRLCDLLRDKPVPATLASHFTSVVLTYFVRASIEQAQSRLAECGANRQTMPRLWPSNSPDPSREFGDLKHYKDNLVINSFGVNRMDNKGAYKLRQLIDAYVSDPRQLPDAAFVRFKMAVTESNIKEHLQNTSQRIKGDGSLKLTADEIGRVGSAIGSPESGSLRCLEPSIMSKLPFYLLFDSRWRRAIADQIAMMTDSNAEREFRSLYGAPR